MSARAVLDALLADIPFGNGRDALAASPKANALSVEQPLEHAAGPTRTAAMRV